MSRSNSFVRRPRPSNWSARHGRRSAPADPDDGHRAGKTKTAAEIIERALAKGKRVVMTMPAKELIDETVQALWNEGIRDVGVIQADHPMTDSSKPVQVASVQTLSRRKLPDADLVIVDEAHRAQQDHLSVDAEMPRGTVPRLVCHALDQGPASTTTI